MEIIDTRKLEAGRIAEANYYSPQGDLLVTKGTVITERHLELMRKRNILEVTINQPNIEIAELQKILNTELTISNI